MDILHLIDRLEEIVDRSPRIPLVGRVIVDPQDLLDLVDRMRIAVPESVRQAERLLDDPARTLTVVAGSRSGADDGRSREGVGQVDAFAGDPVDSRQRATAIVRAAEEQAHAIRQGADQYSLDVLSGLEDQLAALLKQVRRGIETLEREDATPSAP